jgi:hypothetical protein
MRILNLTYMTLLAISFLTACGTIPKEPNPEVDKETADYVRSKKIPDGYSRYYFCGGENTQSGSPLELSIIGGIVKSVEVGPFEVSAIWRQSWADKENTTRILGSVIRDELIVVDIRRPTIFKVIEKTASVNPGTYDARVRGKGITHIRINRLNQSTNSGIAWINRTPIATSSATSWVSLNYYQGEPICDNFKRVVHYSKID